MNKTTLPCAVLFALALAAGCDDELAPEDDAGLPSTCTELTYVNFGKPLLDGKCVSCHAGASASDGVRLDTLADVRVNSSEVIMHAVYRFPLTAT
jgi:hypothetical protein